MATRNFWEIDEYGGHSKMICITGPTENLRLYVDYDDVDHDEVDRLLPEVLDALNRWWER